MRRSMNSDFTKFKDEQNSKKTPKDQTFSGLRSLVLFFGFFGRLGTILIDDFTHCNYAVLQV